MGADDCRQLLAPGAVPARCDLPDGGEFEREPHLVDRPQIRRGEGPDDRPAGRHDLDQILGDEVVDGITHGHPAHTELSGQLHGDLGPAMRPA